MPFLQHFGLNDYPFGLTPNPRLFFPSEQAQALLDALAFAITRGDGLLKVVGEVGSGKTLLCRMLLERLRAQPVNTAYFNAPIAMTGAQLPHLVAREFGLDPQDVVDPLRELRRFLLDEHAQGRRNVLIIDEAQALGVEGLEAVRLLSNLETDTDKLLQIVLFGQAELDQLLRRRDLRQMAQRLSFSFTTKPFSDMSTAAYVRFRLERCAGIGMARAVFSPAALRHLAKTSGGLPRIVNRLADKALLAAYAEDAAIVEPRHIRAALRETPDLRRGWRTLWCRIGLA